MRALQLAFGAALVTNGGHALWRIGVHQGPFFAVASGLIALGGLALMVSAARNHERVGLGARHDRRLREECALIHRRATGPEGHSQPTAFG